MELARQELGEEALLVNARPATPETRYLGAYEVVFGIPPRQTSAMTGSAAITAPEVIAGSGNDRLALEVAGLKREFERMMRTLARTIPAYAFAWLPANRGSSYRAPARRRRPTIPTRRSRSSTIPGIPTM